jgi:hypothetical protein
LSKLTHNWCRGKASPKNCAISVLFKPLPQSKQSPKRRKIRPKNEKFAQSGRPVWVQPFNLVKTRLATSHFHPTHNRVNRLGGFLPIDLFYLFAIL